MADYPYFNEHLSTPNGPGIGDSLIEWGGETRVVVRHVVASMTGKKSGVPLSTLTDEAVTCLYHYSSAQISLENKNASHPKGKVSQTNSPSV